MPRLGYARRGARHSDCIWDRRALPKGGLGAIDFFTECALEGRLDLRLAGLCWIVKDSSRTLWLCSPDWIIYAYHQVHFR